ncbi:general transcription factor IIH subunit 2 [Nasonia vitripennis]|uniref:General transcription factor IIH subunit n=1 Tax=Nasonia vitripennis TaxID=7425 RepID=A0A7M7LR40_NASVI|nr:general transcription factor IIH subunit 2 [Nasonia vitripennis]XP_008208423.1 general transcription factor IIH subunit 2 [Nasonia vitripennis]XP_008208430.1 general transcription factor IIH subunit 2 [Nasonia vitripennis]XP_008208436.1 general transcription factor IIH subunit 2 [Nasonia vitripennis]
MAEEEEEKEYRWETGYEKTWEAIKEDDHGMLEASVADIIHKAKRKRQLDRKEGSRLGMMRHLYIILDCSESMTNQDLKPTRFLCALKLLEDFIDEFFYQNPISQLGIIITRNKRAEKITDLTGNPKKPLQDLKNLQQTSFTGEPSLQNSLELAAKTLKMLPSHASKEILLIMGSLTTCDPGDIGETIQSLKSDGVRCSVIGLAAELNICKIMAVNTGGEHGVVLDDKHFKEKLTAHVDPPPAATRLDAALVKMGFPHHALQASTTELSMAVCMCHADKPDESSRFTNPGYLCPQCLSKHCELPVECRGCGLTLVSAPHLARSYHYLFPIKHFKEEQYEGDPASCYACQKTFVELDKKVYVCEKCKQTFCLDCEIFIHESLHTCPGCATNPEIMFKSTKNSNNSA